jgi:hypothetical protein
MGKFAAPALSYAVQFTHAQEVRALFLEPVVHLGRVVATHERVDA